MLLFRSMLATDPQRRIVDLLIDPRSYSHAPTQVVHLQTPLSHIFVAPPFAYKLKKNVSLSFVDFSTPELRRAVCEDEVVLNQRLCRPIYLGVVPITESVAGELAIDGDGRAIEHLVWMRALPAAGMLPAALEAGRVTPESMREFGRALAGFHASAPHAGPRVADSSVESLRARWSDVLENCSPSVGTTFSALDFDVLADFGPDFLSRHQDSFEGRRSEGRIREGHGDLHASNLCLVDPSLPGIDGAPAVPAGLYAFDCLEFSETLRWNDVASEIAFLAMDLEVRDRHDLAEAFVAAYEQEAGDHGLALLLPYYKAHRACVRAMVHAQTAREAHHSATHRQEAAAHASRFFTYATHTAWGAQGPAIVVCSGLSGSGKTTLAAQIAARTGFVHLSSDEIRKRSAGIDPLLPAPSRDVDDLYTSAARDRAYDDLAHQAFASVDLGRSVIADATFHRREYRARIQRTARERAVPLVFLECAASPEIIRERLEARRREPIPEGNLARSDATWEVYLRQASLAEPCTDEEPVLRIDTGVVPRETVTENALRLLWAWRLSSQAPATTIPRVTRLAATNDQPT